MIVVRVMEGMGNQMLQYALGRHLSIKYKSQLYLDLSWFDKQHNRDFPRDFRLDQFNTQYKKVNLKNIIWRLRYTGRFKAINPFRLKSIKEKNFASFDATVLEAGDNILIEGIFPSFKYFEAIRETLLTDFIPVEKLDRENEKCLQHIKATNSVSVHFRRGDYAHTNYHGMLGNAWYNSAIKLVAQKTSDLQLFIFSDEPEWVLQNMHFDHPFKLIDFNKDKHNYLDMELMKHCRHNIIANSSFSWWPAWLNEHPDKIIIAPEKWVNLDKCRLENIPKEWILL